MEFLKKNHSLIIFLATIVTISLGLVKNEAISIIAPILTFSYAVLERLLTYKTQPDIRSEVNSAFDSHKESTEKSVVALLARIESLEKAKEVSDKEIQRLSTVKSMKTAEGLRF